MIRKYNKNEGQLSQNSKKIGIHSYRNAVYQGELSRINGKRQGRGIIYVTDSHHFIATTQFVSNKLNGNCFFFHQHAKYMYGQWRNNKPHGITVIRIDEVLIIAQFKAGKTSENKKCLVVFQKFNAGVILQVISAGKWKVVSKQDVLGTSDLVKLINDCDFKFEKGQKQIIHHSLIKFLNQCMSSDKKASSKLRLINNSHYRFGYDVGLAVIFDDDFRQLSVGLHNKNALNSFGAKFHSLSLGNKIQEGMFGYSTYTYDKKQKPKHKISELYFRLHLSDLNFRNQVYKDPSDQYFEYFQNLLKDEIVSTLFQKQFLNSSRKMVSTFSQAKFAQNDFQTKALMPFQKMNINSNSLPNFKNPIQEQSGKPSRGIHTLYKYQTWQNQQIFESIQFESLNKKQRLQVLKKQLYQNVNHKVIFQKEEDKQNGYKRSRIITKSPVVIKKPVENKLISTQAFDFKNVEDNQKVGELYMNKDKNQIPNLSRKIDIIIKNEPQMKSSASHSKSRKKIFQQYSNVKRDYSPQTQVSPFKSRIKAKIFEKTPSMKGKASRSPNRIFNKSQTPQKRQQGKLYATKNQNLLNSKQQKSESSSQMKMYPVTLQKAEKPLTRQPLGQFKQQKREFVRNIQKTKIQDFLNLSHQKNIKQQQAAKKSNSVYRNKMKSEYGHYIYEPINVKQTGNTPYVQNKTELSKTMSNATLMHNPSQTTIQRELSKKSIQDPSPSKKEKMGAYMVGQSFGLREAERLSDFKRRVNYF